MQASRGTGFDCDVVPENCGADLYYASNYAAARAAGIRVGAYHRVFIDPEPIEALKIDARAEADLFTSIVGTLRRGDLLPALDVESPFDGASPVQVRVWIKTWIKRVRKTLGVRPIIYTNTTSWAATDDTTKFAAQGSPSLGRELGREQAERPRRQLGRPRMVDLAVHELGHRPGHRGPRRHEPPSGALQPHQRALIARALPPGHPHLRR